MQIIIKDDHITKSTNDVNTPITSSTNLFLLFTGTEKETATSRKFSRMEKKQKIPSDQFKGGGRPIKNQHVDYEKSVYSQIITSSIFLLLPA